MNPILFKFLLEEDILEPFIKNRDEFDSTVSDTRANISSPKYLIDQAFFWDKTQEGNDFWANMRDKYVKYFIKHKKEN